jgi:hypothetical protein
LWRALPREQPGAVGGRILLVRGPQGAADREEQIMLNIAVAQTMVSFVERTAAERRPVDEAAMGNAGSGGLWLWLKGVTAHRGKVVPSA